MSKVSNKSSATKPAVATNVTQTPEKAADVVVEQATEVVGPAAAVVFEPATAVVLNKPEVTAGTAATETAKSADDAAETADEAAAVSDPVEPGEEEHVEEAAKYLEVVSLSKMSLRQPSTGWVIQAGERKEMANDGWLANQIRARLLEAV